VTISLLLALDSRVDLMSKALHTYGARLSAPGVVDAVGNLVCDVKTVGGRLCVFAWLNLVGVQGSRRRTSRCRSTRRASRFHRLLGTRRRRIGAASARTELRPTRTYTTLRDVTAVVAAQPSPTLCVT
jgi:hypothetical protein